jgi:hypothetical protein
MIKELQEMTYIDLHPFAILYEAHCVVAFKLLILNTNEHLGLRKGGYKGDFNNHP